ncbi:MULTISPECIES: MFS transporter [Parageobacillus]|jgi:MFS family permease|uniref:MFS transporter n=1 Tax=Parageobacillus thermoglucosidasius TaxID=1426 RepID=A0A1B7KMV7_PARTM|nr:MULTISPECIES: MFS transporter [Parageobacillus]OAT71319.1 MFS transporter [Parageobacillus thermoglucosidasius]BDG48836.1 putative MFS-type transporter YfkF [Parageobacillus sp. KH3-4]
MRFWILIGIVAISGLSQGMLLPLLSMLLEKHGVSSSLNGMHATALYIGVLLVSPFLEKPLRQYGYRPMIILGGFIVILSLALFPAFHSFLFWFFLRLCIGIGDHMLHFATQTWITDFSPAQRRGRNLSLYGLSFGIGFSAGPLLASLIQFKESLPFLLSSLLSLIGWCSVFFLQNERPKESEQSSLAHTFDRFVYAWKYAWVALLLPFTYGFLEAAVHAVFPVYALREHIVIEHVALILPAFSLGGITFQLPLGLLSDRLGRKQVIAGALLIGSVSFLGAYLFHRSLVGLAACFFIAGMFVGSLFSLGITYMADLLPKQLLPAGNLLCGMLYSTGSMIGPFVNGFAIEYGTNNFFFTISAILFLSFFLLLWNRKKKVIHL